MRLGGANAPAIVVTSQGAHPLTSVTAYNHYSTLATIQQLWGLGCLANTCSFNDTALMTKLFQLTF